MTHPRHKLD